MQRSFSIIALDVNIRRVADQKGSHLFVAIEDSHVERSPSFNFTRCIDISRVAYHEFSHFLVPIPSGPEERSSSILVLGIDLS